MTTVSELGLLSFTKSGENTVKISKENCPPAATISFEDFIMSKEPGRTSKAVPYSGHQICNGIFQRINEIVPDIKRSWGNIHVYRDKMTHPGYVTKMTKESSNSQLLLPDTSISELAFERFIGTVDVISNGDYSARLAVKYEPDNFEMAFGLNVHACENFNILGAERRFQTARGIGYDDLMKNLEQWLRGIERNFGADLNMIERLSQKEIDYSHSSFMLGDMLQRYHQDSQIIQLTDISALSDRIVRKTKENKPVNSLWEFTQAGTEVLRFDDNSGNSIFQSMENFNNYVISHLEV